MKVKLHFVLTSEPAGDKVASFLLWQLYPQPIASSVCQVKCSVSTSVNVVAKWKIILLLGIEPLTYCP